MNSINSRKSSILDFLDLWLLTLFTEHIPISTPAIVIEGKVKLQLHQVSLSTSSNFSYNFYDAIVDCACAWFMIRHQFKLINSKNVFSFALRELLSRTDILLATDWIPTKETEIYRKFSIERGLFNRAKCFELSNFHSSDEACSATKPETSTTNSGVLFNCHLPHASTSSIVNVIEKSYNFH